MSTAPPVTEIPEGETTTSVRIPTRQRAGSMRWKATAYSLLGGIVMIGVWQLASGFTRTEFNLLPSPLSVLQRMGDFTFGNGAEGIEPGWVFVNF